MDVLRAVDLLDVDMDSGEDVLPSKMEKFIDSLNHADRVELLNTLEPLRDSEDGLRCLFDFVSHFNNRDTTTEEAIDYLRGLALVMY